MQLSVSHTFWTGGDDGQKTEAAKGEQLEYQDMNTEAMSLGLGLWKLAGENQSLT